jgi:predicted component of type VI protein secretion system
VREELTRVEGIVVEIREPGRKPRRVPVTAAVEVGRGCKGVLIEDDAASRRHIVLTPGPDGLYVTDLGSSNGTFVNGAPLSGRPRLIAPGDVVRVGETDISLATPAPTAARDHDAPTVLGMVEDPTPPPPPASAPVPAASAAPAPVEPEGAHARRLEAAFGWADVEAGGVEWQEFVDAVVDTGLDHLPEVIARLRAARPER